MLRWLKTAVVSDEEKAHVMRQVGIRKTIIVEVSKSRQTTSKPRCSIDLGMSLAGVR
jgi:vacuolar-type H+-ATPase subunit F/Vma7